MELGASHSLFVWVRPQSFAFPSDWKNSKLRSPLQLWAIDLRASHSLPTVGSALAEQFPPLYASISRLAALVIPIEPFDPGFAAVLRFREVLSHSSVRKRCPHTSQ